MDNKKINRVHSTKFLGVIVDEALTWKNHIEYIKNNVRPSLL